jgi:hypothetical protein
MIHASESELSGFEPLTFAVLASARFAAPLVMQGLERLAFGLRRPKGNGVGGNLLQKIRK